MFFLLSEKIFFMSTNKGNKKGKTLVIVESPAKAKTINKYLGNDFIVKSSVGHIKDLPSYNLGIDIKNDFKPRYEIIKGKAKVIEEIKETAKKSKEVLIATDPDREGEAIAVHLADEVASANVPIHRVIFNEITKNGIKKGLENIRDLDLNLFMSQQARRVLDRIIGFQVSPFLSNVMIGKTSEKLSAGRVQSVALRLIVEREREIQNFEPIDYWNIYADFHNKEIKKFHTQLVAFEGKYIQKPSGSRRGANELETKQKEENLQKLHFIKNQEKADELINRIKKLKEFKVSKKQTKDISRKPYPPFTTSTLQQEAAKQLGFSNKKTMQIAQKLYEGVEIGDEGPVGLITYMRTDSVRISDEALNSVRNFIENEYGVDYLPSKPNSYETKSKNVQDAHEAIRPTNLGYTIDKLKQFLTKDELALYKLIYTRFVASQMSYAQLEQTTIELEAEDLIFRATGSVVKFDGFMKIYSEQKDESTETNGNDDEEEEILPSGIVVGMQFTVKDAYYKQTQTKPPSRYTQAGLIKALDELGIGRPSTYATIVSTLTERKYVELNRKTFIPTELGFQVNDILIKHFENIFNVNFTSKMEEELDDIALGEKTYLETLNEFYKPFSETLDRAKGENSEQSDLICPACGGKLVIRVSRKGRFLGCSNYPSCTHTQPLPKPAEEKKTPEIHNDVHCPKCGKPMYLREGKFGKFFGCIDYPTCDGVLPYSSNVKCPQCGEGHLVEKFSPKTKKKFWSCSTYPKCNYITNYEPVNKTCVHCNNYYLEIHYRKDAEGNWDKYLKCPKCRSEYSFES